MGVNLPHRTITRRLVSRPHARGGEPLLTGDNEIEHLAVPTPVGVNRTIKQPEEK